MVQAKVVFRAADGFREHVICTVALAVAVLVRDHVMVR